MQRFCLTLELRNDPELIAGYEKAHEEVWPPVLESLREAGVQDLVIYRNGTLLMMFLTADDDFSFECKGEMDRANPIVMEWETTMARYQLAEPGIDGSKKWVVRPCVFNFREQLPAG